MDWPAVSVITGVVVAVCCLLGFILRLQATIVETKLQDAIRRIAELEDHGSRHVAETASELSYLKSEVERFKRWQG